MKITNTQPNQSAIDQSRLRWDFQKQGNPPAIELIAGGMRLQWDRCNPGMIDRSSRNPEKTGRFRCNPKSNLTQRLLVSLRALCNPLGAPQSPKGALLVVAIPPQSRPPDLQSARLRLDSGVLANLMQFRRIAHRLDPNRVHSDFTWIAIRGLRSDP